MRWRKLGRVYAPDGSKWWAMSNAMVPTPDVRSGGTVRVYLTMCDAAGIGRIGYVDVSQDDPTRVLKIADNPLLDVGTPGSFDENGMLGTSLVSLDDGTRYLYYVGFELGTKIRYRLLSGLGIQKPGEQTFTRFSRVPILERSDEELFFRGGPFVLREDEKFRMWYVAGSQWTDIGGKEMPVYDIRHIESADGVNWPRRGTPCIRIEYPDEHGFGRPYVLRDGSGYRMFYSVRRISHRAYRMGYAESDDGIAWTRKDDEVGLDVSGEGWDSEAVCYAAVISIKDREYMFYNGNGFGRTGFGVAIRKE